MAQVKFKDGSVMVAGTVTNTKELRHVGDKQSALMEFSIAAGKRDDDSTIFVNIKAWRRLAEYAANAEKGDSACAIGTLESREYNGKIYTDLVCDWLNIVGEQTAKAFNTPHTGVSVPGPAMFEELDEDDPDSLPF